MFPFVLGVLVGILGTLLADYLVYHLYMNDITGHPSEWWAKIRGWLRLP